MHGNAGKRRNMTWLGILNYYILQWFFIRLAKVVDTKTGKIEKWFILKWVFPFSGWNGKPWKYIGKKRNN